MIRYSAITDIGLHRENNQGSYLTIINDNGDFLGLVCDGIGGANAGDVASGEAVNYFEKEFKKAPSFSSLDEASEYLNKHLNIANKKILELANKYPNFNGMGTTVTGVLITKLGVLSINAGDSRVYGFLDDKLFRLTNDHTLVNQMLQNGMITYEESINHPKKHYLVRALGVWAEMEFDIHEVRNMNYYMLCSDGLCGYVSDEEINYILLDNTDVNEKTRQFLDLALMKGGYDNITVVVVKDDENC